MIASRKPHKLLLRCRTCMPGRPARAGCVARTAARQGPSGPCSSSFQSKGLVFSHQTKRDCAKIEEIVVCLSGHHGHTSQHQPQRRCVWAKQRVRLLLQALRGMGACASSEHHIRRLSHAYMLQLSTIGWTNEAAVN